MFTKGENFETNAKGKFSIVTIVVNSQTDNSLGSLEDAL